MATQTTFYRKANVSRAEATASLFKRFPNADLLSFESKTADATEAQSAGANEGDLVYVATIRVAEFPPAEGDDDGGSEGGEEKSEPKEEKPEAPKSDDGGDDDDSGDDAGDDAGAPPFGGGEGGPEGKPAKLSPEEETNHLLREILKAIQGGGALGGPDAGPGGPAGLDLPDIGAPPAGGGLPAPGGPKGGPGAPLPPPVKEKSPIGAGAFAHYDARKSIITVVRPDVAADTKTAALKDELEADFPTHKVAKIQRTGAAEINGTVVEDLRASGLAVATLELK